MCRYQCCHSLQLEIHPRLHPCLTQPCVHEAESSKDVDEDVFQDEVNDSIDNDTLLINAMKTKTKLQPGDIRRVLSSSQNKPSTTANREVHTHERATYNVSAHIHMSSRGALVDRGANGGLAGADVHVIARTDRKVNVSGIDNHQMTNLSIVSARG